MNPPTILKSAKVQEPKVADAKTTTAMMLAKDRARAADVLLQLRYQLSRTVSYIEVK